MSDRKREKIDSTHSTAAEIAMRYMCDPLQDTGPNDAKFFSDIFNEAERRVGTDRFKSAIKICRDMSVRSCKTKKYIKSQKIVFEVYLIFKLL